ncbi:hypothetical protein PF008_g8414 [Phytophthora fragariae]|uniref:Secreted protein n=1 Tax=Phytophthora fragariae TaxID=53985 RepID=A0A6G0RZM3_9STRA|nr:hypothetical protein PF008_g8414 [Phytophthora fragariae]
MLLTVLLFCCFVCCLPTAIQRELSIQSWNRLRRSVRRNVQTFWNILRRTGWSATRCGLNISGESTSLLATPQPAVLNRIGTK